MLLYALFSLSNFLTVSATAFYKCQPVVEFLCEVLRKSQQDLQRGKLLTDAERMKLSREIKGLKVEITHCGTMKRKYRVINVTKQPAQSLKFPLKQMDTGQQREITVARYFQEKHSKKLQWVHIIISNIQLSGVRWRKMWAFADWMGGSISKPYFSVRNRFFFCFLFHFNQKP